MMKRRHGLSILVNKGTLYLIAGHRRSIRGTQYLIANSMEQFVPTTFLAIKYCVPLMRVSGQWAIKYSVPLFALFANMRVGAPMPLAP